MGFTGLKDQANSVVTIKTYNVSDYYSIPHLEEDRY